MENHGCGHSFDDVLGPDDSVSVVFGLSQNSSSPPSSQPSQQHAHPHAQAQPTLGSAPDAFSSGLRSSSWYDAPYSSSSPTQPPLLQPRPQSRFGLQAPFQLQAAHAASSVAYHQQAPAQLNHTHHLEPYPAPRSAAAAAHAQSANPAGMTTVSAATQRHRGLDDLRPSQAYTPSLAPGSAQARDRHGSRANTHIGHANDFRSPASRSPMYSDTGVQEDLVQPPPRPTSSQPLPTHGQTHAFSDAGARGALANPRGSLSFDKWSPPSHNKHSLTPPSIVALSEAPPRPMIPSSPLVARQERRHQQQQRQQQQQPTPPGSSSGLPRHLRSHLSSGAGSVEHLCALLDRGCALALQMRGQTSGHRAAFVRGTMDEARQLRHDVKVALERRGSGGGFDAEFSDLFRVFFGTGGLD